MGFFNHLTLLGNCQTFCVENEDCCCDFGGFLRYIVVFESSSMVRRFATKHFCEAFCGHNILELCSVLI